MQGTYDTIQVITWSEGPIETLGIKIPTLNRHEIFEINHEPKIK